MERFTSGPSSIWAIGTGSRFESIQRGVIDLRDLVYYLSLAGIFLSLNVLSLESIRWSRGTARLRKEKEETEEDQYEKPKRWAKQGQRAFLTTTLFCLNLVLVNAWLFPLQGLRVDLTQQKEYTLSATSRDLLSNLQEPLLIRAYISEKTHPLLKPLEPQIRDMLREYEIASGGRVTAEVIDPITDPEVETEANQTYGIRPTPFQISGRYEAAVINSYFNILVRYGDQSVVLNFQDFIEVKQSSDGVDVRLRNLEYDLTSAVKKVVYGFQSVDAVLAALDEPVLLTLYITPNTIPEDLTDAGETILNVASQIASSSNGKLEFQALNPDDPASGVSRQALLEAYGIQPFPVDFFGAQTYYMHMVLQNGDQIEVIYPSGDLSEGEVRTAIESSLKRTGSGFLKVIGLWTPPNTPTQDMFGQMQQPLSSYNIVGQQLGGDYTVETVDLSRGSVPAGLDVLIVIAPENLGELEGYAIDQYLMRGGSVILAVSKYKATPDSFSGFISMQPIYTGVEELLQHYGVQIDSGVVLDLQNMPFPIVGTRDLGGFQVQEIQSVNYPFFVDILPSSMDSSSPIMSNLASVTLSWVSPVRVDEGLTESLDRRTLLESSPESWLDGSLNILPDYELYPETGFAVSPTQAPLPLAISLQGSFTSYYADKPAPTASEPAGDGLQTFDDMLASPSGTQPLITTSPASARLVVIGTAFFVDDFVLELSSRLSQDKPLNNLLFMQNAVDWAVQDLDMLTIRNRGTTTRLLLPLDTDTQRFWEIANYLFALAALGGIYFTWRYKRQHEAPLALIPPGEAASSFQQKEQEDAS